MVQDGTVEGHVLITSSKSSKIVTNCWTTIGTRTLEPNKKRYLTSKNKEEATVRQWEGKQSGKNQIPYPPCGWPTDWRTIIPKSLHRCEGSEPQVKFPSLRIQKRTGNPQGIWPWGPGGFDYRTSRGLRETETWTSVLEGTHRILQATRPRGQWPHRRLNQNCLLVLEAWVSRGSPRERGAGKGLP